MSDLCYLRKPRLYVRDVDLGKKQTFHLVTSAHESSCLISSTGPGTISMLVTKYVVVRLFTQSHHLPLHSTVCGKLLIQISKKNKATGNKKITK